VASAVSGVVPASFVVIVFVFVFVFVFVVEIKPSRRAWPSMLAI
jgi:hypothetical protein